MEPNPLQRSAHELTQRGLIVQPAHRGKKYPVAMEWQNAEPMSGADIHETWTGGSPPNISVLTGERGGIFVVDVDVAGRAHMPGLIAGRDLPPTYVVKTPSGGFHLYYTYPPGHTILNSQSKLAPGIDVRGNGGQVIGAGSVLEGGGAYVASNDKPIVDAPQWLIDAVVAASRIQPDEPSPDISIGYTEMSAQMQEAARAYVRSAVEGIRSDLRASAATPVGQPGPKGMRWEELQATSALRLAQLARAAWNPLTMEQAREAFASAAPTDENWPTSQVQAKWRDKARKATPAPMPPDLGRRESIFGPATDADGSAEAPQWRMHSWDDVGNGERLAAYAGDRLRWVPELKKWARYADGVWQIDSDGGPNEAQRMMKDLGGLERGLYGQGAVEDFDKFLAKSRLAARVEAAARMLRYSGVVNASTRDFDTHLMKLNVANGVIDLRTGELLPHDPGYQFLQQSTAQYDPLATAPMWERFLEEMIPERDMRDYLQRVVGYTLTGLVTEQVSFLHHGETKNGKSVFLDVVEAMLGTYAQTVPPQTLLTKRGPEQHPADVARMEGKRMLLLAETPQGARLDEALVKRLSGGDTVTARGMGEEFRDFKISGKVHLVTNHLPHINHDQATMRRLRLIHWSQTVPEGRRDKFLAAKIVERELAGVLMWALRGCLEWQRRGDLDPPLSAQADAQQYIEEEDLVGRWMSEVGLVSDDTMITPFSHVGDSYRGWCHRNGLEPMSLLTLGKDLTRRGIREHRTSTTRFRRARMDDQAGVPPDPFP